jgi:tetratricopeptide (TPR) repeat protein
MKGSDASRMDEIKPPTPTPPDGSRRERRYRQRSPLEHFRKDFNEAFPSYLTLLLSLVVVGSLLAVGAVHVITVLLVTVGAVLCAAVTLFAEDNWKRAVPAPAWVLAGLSFYTFLQSVPIPWRWLHRLSRISAQSWADARIILGTAAHRAAPLSVDPGATRVEGLKWLCYAAVFISAASLARRKGAKRGLSLVVLAAIIGGVLTIGHGLLGLDRWLGIYKPTYVAPSWALSPLLNPNNNSGYLNLATFCAIGLAMTGRPPAPRWALGVTAGILSGLSFLTGSRGGALSLLIGSLLVTLALREQARRQRRSGAPILPSWLPITGIVVVGGGLFILGSTSTIWDQLLDETTSKLRIVEWTAPIIADHRWFGIGRGAYETASAAYRATPGLVIYQHAENFLADWLAEWGLPVASFGIVALTWLLRPKQLGFLRHPIPTASMIGVFVLLLHNLVDLGLEIASVGIALFTVLGALWGGAARDRERRAAHTQRHEKFSTDKSEFQSEPSHDLPAKTPRPKEDTPARNENRRQIARRALVRVGAWVAIASGFVIWTARTSQPDAADERSQMHDAFGAIDWNSRSNVKGFRSQLALAVERHPADPYLPVLGGLVARSTGQNALPWLNHALRRDPLNARAQLLLADVLASRGYVHQALISLKACATNEPGLGGVIADRARQFSQSIDELQLTVPDGPAGVVILDALAMQFGKSGEKAVHEALLQLAFARQPQSVSTHAIAVDDLLREFEDPKSACSNQDKAGCETKLLRHAQVIESQQGPKSLQAVIVRARILAHQQKLDEAVAWLSKSCPQFSTDATCSTYLVDMASRSKNMAALDEAAATHLAIACSTAETCSGAATWIGNLYMALGGYDRALMRFERAANELPSASAWSRVANAAFAAGHISRAQSALIAAKRLGGPSDSNLEQQIERARQEQLLHEALRR